MTNTQTFTLGSGEERVTYDVHGDLSTKTPLFMFGSPMDAVGFGSLLARFDDRPVVTYDPRGAGRNPTGTSEVTPEMHASDLHRVIGALGGTGGRIRIKWWCNQRASPARCALGRRTAVRRARPACLGLPSRQRGGRGSEADKGGLPRGRHGPSDGEVLRTADDLGRIAGRIRRQANPDPAQFGLPTEDDGDRTNLLFRAVPAGLDFAVADSLRDLGDRVVIGIGAESHDELAARGAKSVAKHLGVWLVEFPGGHGGFSGGEYGQPAGDPDGFAAVLRSLL